MKEVLKSNLRYQFVLTIVTNLFLILNNVYAQELPVVYSSGSYYSGKIRTIFDENIRYISTEDFADLFNARTYFDNQNKKITIYLDDKILKITAFNPFILIDQQVYQLPAKTELVDGDIYVPLIYFIEIINRIFPNRILFNQWKNRLEINPLAFSNINNIDIEEKANGTLISISTSNVFSESELSLRSSNNWIYVDILGGKVDSSALYTEYSNGLVAEIVPSQVTAELTQIGFRLRDEAIEKQLILKNSKQILVSLKTKKDLSKEVNKDLDSEKKRWLIDRIIIDPGHGGRDPGAIGKLGTKEKDVVLSISHYLKELLEDDLDVEVLMTRDDDRFIALNQRTEFANLNQAKLFISIHANSNRNRKINGVSTYFLGPENTEEAREVANLENSVIDLENGSKYADLSQERYILSAIAQNIYNKESQDLADIVQREVSDECNLRDIGVKQAGFYVLWGASMPNILIETAFISNVEEEKLLRSRTFQKKQALAIFRSIKKFKERYESQL